MKNDNRKKPLAGMHPSGTANAKLGPVAVSASVIPIERRLDNLLPAVRVCEILGISRRTLFNYTHWYKGKPPVLGYVLRKGKPMFPPYVVEGFIRKRTIGMAA